MVRFWSLRLKLIVLLLGIVLASPCGAQAPAAKPVAWDGFVYERARADAWQWYAAPPAAETYGYGESLFRLGISGETRRWNWKAELAQATILEAPANSINSNTAQGQLGLGATYYASNENNSYPSALFLKQAFATYLFRGTDKNVRAGRFEFFDGLETKPTNPTLAWLQKNRVAQRLIGNFGFSDAQRSFDGVDGHYGKNDWDLTAMAGRADQGVFNMNGNPELNVDVQYLALSHYNWHQRLLWRAFAIGYHDGRTGILKIDNRPLPVRQADHRNIRIGTYGGDFLAAIPAGKGQFDLLGWGLVQNGQWGTQQQKSAAATFESGYRFLHLASAPWLRAGWFRSSGDNDPTDNKHTTFFELLPTPRLYARFPFYNLMDIQDRFIQLVDSPAPRWVLRSDVHSLRLGAARDLWYLGGGAYDNKVFGYAGRPSSGFSTLATVADVSSDWRATDHLDIGLYYAYSWGNSVIASIYPKGKDAQFGFIQIDYHWVRPK